jgi:hypothetical protein
VTNAQLSHLIALHSALATTASTPIPADGPASNECDEVSRAYARLSALMARRTRAVTVTTQALQNVLSSEQLAKLVRCAERARLSSPTSSGSAAAAAGSWSPPFAFKPEAK